MAKAITIARASGFTIGELARRTEVNLENIRYFERIGLLQASHRTEGGHRVFTQEHARRLTFIRHAREMGFSQESVRTLLELSDGHLTSCGEVKAIASEHLQVIRSRIEKLKRLEAILAATLAKCSGGKVPSCPVIDTLAESLSVEQ